MEMGGKLRGGTSVAAWIIAAATVAALLSGCAVRGPIVEPTVTPTPSSTASAEPSPEPSPDPVSSPSIDPRQLVAVAITQARFQDDRGIEVVALVVDFVEEGGTCTVHARRDGVDRTVEGAAVADATGTSCGRLRIPLTELVPGTWSVSVEYSSAHAQGRSDEMEVEVGS